MRDQNSTVATPEQLKSRSREVPFYDKDPPEIKPAAQELFEKYADIPSDQVVDHVYAIREKAWDIWPYPCIGGFRFIDLNLCTTPQYPEVLERLKNGERLLDLGCFVGQEIRRLILDGVPSENPYGTDLRPEFFELGYELFRDREKCKSTFFAANAFEPSLELEKLDGGIGIVYAGSFFHLFDRLQQLQLAKRVTALLAQKPGSMVLGRQVGNVKSGRYDHATNEGGYMYRHNEQSWREMWEEAGRETGTKWEVQSELRMTSRFAKAGYNAEGARMMFFCVRRV